MKKNFTKIIFVVDKSGSMTNIASDVIGGYNGFIATQKANNYEKCEVSFYTFNQTFDTVYENVSLSSVEDLNGKTYIPTGFTALYDAVGETINKVGKQLSDMREDERPEKVLMVIITDGMENSSKKFAADQIKGMIKHQTDVYKWVFSYIGANQDAWEIGASLGISKETTMTWASNSKGSRALFTSLSSAVSSYATTGSYAFTQQDITAQVNAMK